MTSAGFPTQISDPKYPREVTVMGAFSCDGCKKLSVAWKKADFIDLEHVNAGVWLESVSDYLNWEPRSRIDKEFPDVPDYIASAASEAHECFSINAYRGAVLLARSVIEATAKDNGITNGNLFNKIEKMAERDLIRERVKEEAHEIRALGNDMAHGDFVEPVDPDDTEAVLVLMGEVLEEIYQAPAQLNRIRAKREAKNAATEGTSTPA
jgi:hypothetical protein